MKKTVITTLTMLVFAFTNAQEKNINYGIKGTASSYNLNGDLGNLDGGGTGFQIGAFAEVKLTEKFAIQPEILLSKRIYDYKDESPNHYYIEMRGIDIPVMAKYYVSPKFSIEMGPQINFITGSKQLMEITENEDYVTNFKNEFKPIDFGVNLGIEYHITKKLSLGARYNIGLTNISKSGTGEDGTINRNSFSLSISYKF